MASRVFTSGAAILVLLFVSTAAAGPDHIEDGDAGSVPGTAQKVYKSVTLLRLDTIEGTLGSTRGIDREDMYLIRIVDPANFRASTVPDDGGSAEFDSQLWLFKPIVPPQPGSASLGLLGNNDFAPGGNQFSRLRPMATDGTGAQVTEPGDYFIAISAFGTVPLSVGGPIFQFAAQDEVSGPDGPGAGAPHVDWTDGPSMPGQYVIAFTGVEGFPRDVPALSPFGIVILALAVAACGAVLIGIRGKSESAA